MFGISLIKLQARQGREWLGRLCPWTRISVSFPRRVCSIKNKINLSVGRSFGEDPTLNVVPACPQMCPRKGLPQSYQQSKYCSTFLRSPSSLPSTELWYSTIQSVMIALIPSSIIVYHQDILQPYLILKWTRRLSVSFSLSSKHSLAAIAAIPLVLLASIVMSVSGAPGKPPDRIYCYFCRFLVFIIVFSTYTYTKQTCSMVLHNILCLTLFYSRCQGRGTR